VGEGAGEFKLASARFEAGNYTQPHERERQRCRSCYYAVPNRLGTRKHVKALRKILHVDDNPDILTVSKLALERVGGYEVSLANSGKEAIAVAARFLPDLILLDVLMPEMDGCATLIALRGVPETARIPVVFLSASVMPEKVAEYKRLGALDVIAKPFDPLKLPEQVGLLWQANADTLTQS
jgi:two-component system, OmpR family, response regulator